MFSLNMCCVSMYGGLINGYELSVCSLPVSVTAVSELGVSA